MAMPILRSPEPTIEIVEDQEFEEPGKIGRRMTIRVGVAEIDAPSVTIDVPDLPAGVAAEPAFPIRLRNGDDTRGYLEHSFNLTAGRTAPAIRADGSITLMAAIEPAMPAARWPHRIELEKKLLFKLGPRPNDFESPLGRSSSFTVGTTPSTLEIPQGESAEFDVAVSGRLFRDARIWIGQPAMSTGVQISPPQTFYLPRDAASARHHTVTVAPDAPRGTQIVLINASGTGFDNRGRLQPESHTVGLRIKTLAPDFNLSLCRDADLGRENDAFLLAPGSASLRVDKPESASIVLRAARVDGLAVPISFRIKERLPAHLAVDILQRWTDTNEDIVKIIFSTDSETVEKHHALTILATAQTSRGTIDHSYALDLNITSRPGDFLLLPLDPESLSVARGNISKPVTVSFRRYENSPTTINVEVPPCDGLRFAPPSPIAVPVGQSQCSFTIEPDLSAKIQANEVGVFATAGGRPIEHGANVTVTVIADQGSFNLVPHISPGTISLGSSAQLDIVISRFAGFSLPVDITLSGVPSDITAERTSETSDYVTYELTADEDANFGGPTLIITGACSGLAVPKTAQVQLSVQPLNGRFEEARPTPVTGETVIPSDDNRFAAKVTQLASGGMLSVQFEPTPWVSGGSSSTVDVPPGSGVCFSASSKCGVILTDDGNGYHTYTIFWLYGSSGPTKTTLQVSSKCGDKSLSPAVPRIAFSPDGTRGVVTSAKPLGCEPDEQGNYEPEYLVNVLNTRRGHVMMELKTRVVPMASIATVNGISNIVIKNPDGTVIDEFPTF